MMLYFREFAGMITVVAAAFSLGKLVRSNELIAIMASGVSLKRIVTPILIMAILLSGLAVVNQEILIPHFNADLVLNEDESRGEGNYIVTFLPDENDSLICADHYYTKEKAFHNITIITRQPTRERPEIVFEVTGRIRADKATYNPDTGAWDLANGQWIPSDGNGGIQARASYRAADLVPKDIPVLVMADISLLSWRQLVAKTAHNPRDIAQIYSQKNFRVTEHLINLVMLLVCLPVLLVRDPRTMKTAIMISFGLTAACMIVTFACKMLATEEGLFSFPPEFWAWLPVFIFAPVAFIELDTMKT
jgi:lipopolysaccharide export LptBFGC system permease protein LptF